MTPATWSPRALDDPVRVHTLRCARAGHQDVPVFVLVHGIGASHGYFQRLQRELARTGDAHAVDLPGFGGLPRPDGPRSIAQLQEIYGIGATKAARYGEAFLGVVRTFRRELGH